jgi:hypothetical protein
MQLLVSLLLLSNLLLPVAIHHAVANVPSAVGVLADAELHAYVDIFVYADITAVAGVIAVATNVSFVTGVPTRKKYLV